MNLFVNYYIDPNEERQKEITTCLYHNLMNKAITMVYAFAKKEDQAFQDDNLFWVDHAGRPTFKDFFALINSVTNGNDINVIANSDIFFAWEEINANHNQCFALTRWDILPDGSEKFYNNPGSQDTWVFRGPIKQVKGGDYTQGVAGCDNKIAWDLEQAGYKVSNPSKTIKTYHLHNTEVWHYKKHKNDSNIFRLPHPRKNVQITSL